MSASGAFCASIFWTFDLMRAMSAINRARISL
jgi:hypothetical protein